MRAIVAKRLRRQAYGKGHHPGPTRHFFADKYRTPGMPRCLHGCCVADQDRRDYQHLKRRYMNH